MKTKKAHLVINTTYTLHPDDLEIFADAVRPHIKETQKLPGCVFYTFSFDLVDKNLCHLAEGWTDRQALNEHGKSPKFQDAYSKVIDTVRILDYEGVIYTVSEEAPIKPQKL